MLKLQNFSHLMRRANSLEKMLMLGKIEDRKKRVHILGKKKKNPNLIPMKLLDFAVDL